MPDLEKTIRELENFIESYKQAFDDDGYAPLEDAISLLKAQEPRVMTLDEVETWNNQSIYSKENIFIENFADDFGTLAYVGDFRNRSYPTEESAFSGYGKSWRCWTSRPTDEQREAVKWND